MNLLSLLLIIFSAVLIFLYYRNTNPPITHRMKWLLGLLRFLFFVIIILLIFNPTLRISRTKSISPTTVILVDSSASMNQPLSSDQTKSQAAALYIQNVHTFLDEHSIEHQTVYFSNGITQDSTSTDIFLALKELNDNSALPNISEVILISDGLQSNNDSYPLIDNLSFPVFPLILGHDEEMRDVSLDEVRVNNPLYLNMETEISCTISGLPDSTLFTVAIKDKNGNILQKERFDTNEHQREFFLSFTPVSLGYHKLYAEITLENHSDFSLDNNQCEFLVSVVKDKAQFALISSSLNWDITFIHRALLKNERYETSLIAQREEGYFLDDEQVSLPEIIGDTDVLILHNPNVFNFDTPTFHAIETYISRGGNILYLGKIDPALSSILPLQVTRFSETVQSTILPTVAMENYQTFAVQRDKSTENFWNELPPITTYFYQSKPGTEILARADIASENPVIVFSTFMQGHILQFSGYDYYRWKMREDPKQQWFDQFIMNIGQWLLNTDISQKFICAPEKLSYLEGEPVEFSAHIFDEKMNLVKNQDIKIQIMRNDSLVAEKFFIQKDDQYTTDFNNLVPGNYSYKAEIVLGNRIYKNEGEFLVEERSLEQSMHGLQNAYLQYIVSKTHGDLLIPESDYSQLLEVTRTEKMITTTRNIELWKKWYLVVIAILLIATELFLRKKKGLL